MTNGIRWWVGGRHHIGVLHSADAEEEGFELGVHE
jgi:hypothetical protein